MALARDRNFVGCLALGLALLLLAPSVSQAQGVSAAFKESHDKAWAALQRNDIASARANYQAAKAVSSDPYEEYFATLLESAIARSTRNFRQAFTALRKAIDSPIEQTRERARLGEHLRSIITLASPASQYLAGVAYGDKLMDGGFLDSSSAEDLSGLYGSAHNPAMSLAFATLSLQLAAQEGVKPGDMASRILKYNGKEAKPAQVQAALKKIVARNEAGKNAPVGSVSGGVPVTASPQTGPGGSAVASNSGRVGRTGSGRGAGSEPAASPGEVTVIGFSERLDPYYAEWARKANALLRVQGAGVKVHPFSRATSDMNREFLVQVALHADDTDLLLYNECVVIDKAPNEQWAYRARNGVFYRNKCQEGVIMFFVQTNVEGKNPQIGGCSLRPTELGAFENRIFFDLTEYQVLKLTPAAWAAMPANVMYGVNFNPATCR